MTEPFVRWPILLALAGAIFAAVAWMFDSHGHAGHADAVDQTEYREDIREIKTDIREINRKIDRAINVAPR